MTTEQEWARRVYERHLDLLLAEELSCNDEFARWFVEHAVLVGRIPDGTPLETMVEVSHDDDVGIETGAGGENDLFVSARWPNGRVVRILIEDKLDAVVQPISSTAIASASTHTPPRLVSSRPVLLRWRPPATWNATATS